MKTKIHIFERYIFELVDVQFLKNNPVIEVPDELVQRYNDNLKEFEEIQSLLGSYHALHQ